MAARHPVTWLDEITCASDTDRIAVAYDVPNMEGDPDGAPWLVVLDGAGQVLAQRTLPVAAGPAQLATLVQSNLPLDECLRATAEQSRKARTKGLLLQVRSRVAEGHTLAYAMGEFPQVFNEMYRAMVNAGEHAGYLGPVLQQLADYTEQRQQLRTTDTRLRTRPPSAAALRERIREHRAAGLPFAVYRKPSSASLIAILQDSP